MGDCLLLSVTLRGIETHCRCFLPKPALKYITTRNHGFSAEELDMQKAIQAL